MRGDAISPLGSTLVQIWFEFPDPRIKVPYSQELGPFEGPIAVIDNDGSAEIVAYGADGATLAFTRKGGNWSLLWKSKYVAGMP